MSHPLIERLTTEYDVPEVGLDEHEAFIGQPGMTVLFFAGDPKRYKETTDVAVVLLELLKRDYPVELVAVFTVQEEIGLRGARVAAYAIEPDVAIVAGQMVNFIAKTRATH